MAAYVIGHMTIKNFPQWEQYISGVRKSLLPYDTTIICRGSLVKILAGEHLHQNTVVIKFEDQKAVQNWYSSKEYQDLIPLRDSAAEIVLMSYDD